MYAVVTLRPSRFCNQIQLLFTLCGLQSTLTHAVGAVADVDVAVGFSKDMWRHTCLSLCTDPLLAAPHWKADFAVSGGLFFYNLFP